MADDTKTREDSVEGQRWQDVLQRGDRDQFHELTEGCSRTIIDAARRELNYYIDLGHIHADDFSPEEVAGQTLIFAWEHRDRCPQKMSLRGWLLGTQHRVLRGLVDAQRQYRREKALSLDEPLELNTANYDTQEWFYEWYQPDATLHFEDVVADRLPDDVEVDPVDSTQIDEEDPTAYHTLVLHDEFEMTLPEVAFTMNRSVDSIAEMLQKARASLRERQPREEATFVVDQPAPPEGSDE